MIKAGKRPAGYSLQNARKAAATASKPRENQRESITFIIVVFFIVIAVVGKNTARIL